MALVLAAYERTAEFKRGTDLQEQALVVAENGVRIKAFDAVSADDLVGIAGAVSARDLARAFVPKKQVPVVVVEMIEVGAAPCAFAGGAEGNFAEAAKFVKQMRKLGGARCVDGKLRVFGEEAVGGKTGNIVNHEARRNRRRNWLLRPARKYVADSRGKGNCSLAAMRQKIGAQTKVLGRFLVALEAVDQFGWDGLADAHANFFFALLEKFLEKEQCTQARMNQAKKVERQAVTAGEINGQSSGGGLADQARGGRIPQSISDMALADVQVGNLSSRKHR